MSNRQQAPELGNLALALNRGSRHSAPGEDSRDSFWSEYLKEAMEYDDVLAEKYKADIDIVVFFAGLFSAVQAAFLTAMQPTLSPNPSDTTNALLMILIHTVDNSTFPGQSLTIPQWNGPPSSTVYSQALGYVSLSLSLSAALGAVVGKQWLSNFSRLGTGTDEVRGRRRQRRLEALNAWKFRFAMELLPALLQVALALFAIALCINLWGINQAVALALICATALSGLVYMALTMASLWFPSCPYQTPFSEVIRWTINTAVHTTLEIAADSTRFSPKLMIRMLAKLLPLVLLPVFGWATIFLTIFVTITWLFTTRFQYSSFILQLLSGLKGLTSQWQPPLAPQYLDFSSAIWILEVSTHHNVLKMAVERLSDAALRPSATLDRNYSSCDVLEVQRFTMRLSHLFIASVHQMHWQTSNTQRDRATAIGKALIHRLQIGRNSAQDDIQQQAPSWDEAILSIARLLGDESLDSEIIFLVYLVFAFLPVADNARNMIYPPQQPVRLEANQIPRELLLWSLPLFPQNCLHWNQYLTTLFTMLHPALEHVSSSDRRKWDASELSSYLRPCQAYLEILRQQSRERPLDWSVIRQILTLLHCADEAFPMSEDGCLPDTLDRLSDLLGICPSWPENIHSAVHELVFGTYLGAKELLQQASSSRLVRSAIHLAAADSYPENHIDTRIDQILPFLLDCLIDAQHVFPEEDILKIVQACSAEGKKLIWQHPDVVPYLLSPIRPFNVQHLGLRILLAACKSGGPDKMLEPLLSRDDFRHYIGRAIGSENLHTGLQFLDFALPYLLCSESNKARWQEEFGFKVSLISESDTPSPESSFSLIRIKCALRPDRCSWQLSKYWRTWMEKRSPLEVAHVVPMAQWVLTHCEPSPPQTWYTELRDGFDGLLRVAWGGEFKDDLTLLRELADCTKKYVDRPLHDNTTIATVRAAAHRILEDPQKYDLKDDDSGMTTALQRFKDLK